MTVSCPSSKRTRYGGCPPSPRTSMITPCRSVDPTVLPCTTMRSPWAASMAITSQPPDYDSGQHGNRASWQDSDMPLNLLLIADTHVPKRARSLPAQVWHAVDEADVVFHAGDWVEAPLLDEFEHRSRRLLGV